MDVFLIGAVNTPWKRKFPFCSDKCVLIEALAKIKSGSKTCLGVYSLDFASEEYICQRFMHQKGTLPVEGCFNWQQFI